MSDRKNSMSTAGDVKDGGAVPKLSTYAQAVEKSAEALPAEILDLVSELYWNERPPIGKAKR